MMPEATAMPSISIHTLRVEGDCHRPNRVGRHCISIHTLRVEGDMGFAKPCLATIRFQSTPSAWRVTIAGFDEIEKLEFQSTPSAWRVTQAF